MQDNPFRDKTAQELLDEKQQEKTINLKIKQVAEKAARCLASSDFAEYRQAYIVAQKEIINYMKKFDEPDPIKYNAVMRTCLAKLDILEMLLEGVEKDNKKGKRKEKTIND